MIEAERNAAVAGNNLFSFSGVASHHRTDIMNMLMYADYYATQTWRPQSQWTSWINYYRNRLTSSGCNLKGHIVKPAMVINRASELDTISFEVVGSVRVSDLIALAQRSFRAARLNEYARHFFESGSGSGYTSAFQVVPCESVGPDEVSILVCALHASATVASDGRGGDWRVNREMVVRLVGGVYSFSSEAYAPHRERIRSRLQEVANFNIRMIDI